MANHDFRKKKIYATFGSLEPWERGYHVPQNILSSAQTTFFIFKKLK